jgi:hypothetical protein
MISLSRMSVKADHRVFTCGRSSGCNLVHRLTGNSAGRLGSVSGSKFRSIQKSGKHEMSSSGQLAASRMIASSSAYASRSWSGISLEGGSVALSGGEVVVDVGFRVGGFGSLGSGCRS